MCCTWRATGKLCMHSVSAMFVFRSRHAKRGTMLLLFRCMLPFNASLTISSLSHTLSLQCEGSHLSCHCQGVLLRTAWVKWVRLPVELFPWAHPTTVEPALIFKSRGQEQHERKSRYTRKSQRLCSCCHTIVHGHSQPE